MGFFKRKGLFYWESEAYNQQLYNMFLDDIMSLAVNRYKWLNLPATCNARWLEWLLLTRGSATIASPGFIRSLSGKLYTLECVQFGEPNAYNDPSRWIARGVTGRIHFNCTNRNGVWIWDNMTRYPLMQKCEIWARELVDVVRTKQVNRFHQKMPYIVQGDNKQKNMILNYIKQVAGYEQAIIANNSFDGIEAKVLSTNVPYLGEELTIEEKNIWSNIYLTLGIKNLTYKAERMVQDEIDTQQAPTDLKALNGLQPRREAAEKLNNIFGTNIQVVWNQDNYSANYNLLNNIEEQAKAGVIDNDSTTV